MKILVTGSNGMLGWGIKKVFTEDTLICTDVDTLDVTNINQVMGYAEVNPDIIFHLAAETDHYRAEMNPLHTYFINHTGTMNIVALANKLKVPIVYIGTCGIFDGTQEEYHERDTPSPLNHYGRSKWYGEESTLCASSFVIRSGWAMGGGAGVDKKFIGLVYNQIKNGAKRIYAITDVYGTPTYTPYFAKTIKNIINTGVYGIYHYSGGKASRYDVGKEFVRLLGIDVEVIPVTYDEYHAMFPLKVPYTKCEVLATRKTDSILIHKETWQEGLAEYVNECFK